MTRPIAAFLLFLALAILQTSLFSSLPSWLAYTPLVVAAGVYLVQHGGERAGAFWIAGFGLFLDILALSSFPLEAVSYAAAGVAAYVSAQHLFSNRSWYGLVACGAAAVLSLNAVRALVLGVVSLRHPERVSWLAFGDTLLWNLILVAVLLTLFFAFAKQIRGLLRAGFMVSRERDTL